MSRSNIGGVNALGANFEYFFNAAIKKKYGSMRNASEQ